VAITFVGVSVVNFGLSSLSGFVCGKKICRVHKNQAVNLLQIAIHGKIGRCFLGGGGVIFNKSRHPTGFAAEQGYTCKKNLIIGFAAKFLQSTPLVYV